MSGFEVFGAIGGVGALAGVFTSCVDCFQYVQLGRSFGDDFRKDRVRLDNQALRLTRWGQAVGICGPPDGTDPEHLPSLSIPPDEADRLLHGAEEILEEIARLFVRAAKKCKRFESKATSEELELYNTAMEDNTQSSLHKWLQSLASRRRLRAKFRQTKATIGQVTRWALYDKEQFERFIDELKGFIDDLVELFPPQILEAQRTIVTYEVEEIGDTEDVKLLISAVGGDDNLVYEVGKAIIEARTGHVFEDNETGKGAFAQFGDHIDSKYRGQFKKSGNIYRKNIATDSATVRYGDNYGGLDIFQSRTQTRADQKESGSE
jgi:hypothetical protein